MLLADKKLNRLFFWFQIIDSYDGHPFHSVIKSKFFHETFSGVLGSIKKISPHTMPVKEVISLFA